MNKNGFLIISLDFELYWGVHDVFTMEQYGENILGVREAIPKILELFDQYETHATWATVGLLAFENKKELLENLPELKPGYTIPNFSPYPWIERIGENEFEDPYHFGSSLIRKIVDVPFQELGTHTFSHYYCLEDGQTVEEFLADLASSITILESYDETVQSLVFPRNQTNEEFLSACKTAGILAYRGNEDSWIYRPSGYHQEGKIKRLVRLLDSYMNVQGHGTYKLDSVEQHPIVNLPSSRFLRPYHSKLKYLERLKINRIKRSMFHAAKNNEVFHLWWHPHNFGKDVEENINNLREILQYFNQLKESYHFQSINMKEAASIVLGETVAQ